MTLAIATRKTLVRKLPLKFTMSGPALPGVTQAPKNRFDDRPEKIRVRGGAAARYFAASCSPDAGISTLRRTGGASAPDRYGHVTPTVVVITLWLTPVSSVSPRTFMSPVCPYQ